MRREIKIYQNAAKSHVEELRWELLAGKFACAHTFGLLKGFRTDFLVFGMGSILVLIVVGNWVLSLGYRAPWPLFASNLCVLRF